MKKVAHTLVLAGLMSVPMLAIAEDSPHTLTGNVTLTSNYIFRGISQSGGDMAIQGGLDYTHKSGFYLGTWGSSVGWIEDFQGYTKGNMEIDLYGGYRGAIGESGVTFDVGAIQYMYPGDKPAATIDADTSEIYGALGWKWFTLKYSYYLSDEVFGFGPNADGSDYIDVSASLPIGETGFTVGAHWGTFKFENFGNQDYDDWKLSVTYDMGKVSDRMTGVTLGVMYTDTNARKANWSELAPPVGNSEFLGDDAFTVWISKAL